MNLARHSFTTSFNMLLYHTGYQEIREPDIHHGRKMPTSVRASISLKQ